LAVFCAFLPLSYENYRRIPLRGCLHVKTGRALG
jgi:hypothetical protein